MTSWNSTPSTGCTHGPRPESTSPGTARTGHYFYVLADGNAVNFLHGASVGAFIHLVQAEILAATATLATAGHDPGLHELDASDRTFIAATWLRYFDGTS